MSVTDRDLSGKVNHPSKYISSPIIDYPVLIMNINVSEDKQISGYID